MPRIHDAYLDCVVYVYPTEVDAEDGTRAGGSGFLVGVPSTGLKQNFWFLYAVTNKHVIKGGTVLRMNTRAGEKSIVPTTRTSWIAHPDGDDLAACLISFDPKDIKFNHVPRSSFLSREIVSQFNIGPGDDCFIIGRFVNHEGQQQNLPTVRFGNIAQMPWEKIRQDDGFEQESFLVECRSIGGSSGSPIFVHIPIFSDRPGIPDWFPHPNIIDGSRIFGGLKAHGPWLLGVNWGYIHDWSPLCGKDEKPVNRDPEITRVKLSTGIAGTVPAWKLAELLDNGPLANERADVEKLIREEQAKELQSVATTTEVKSE